VREAVSVSNVFSSSHRLGILMSDQARFVSCIDCHPGISIPEGVGYSGAVKQFESQTCRGPDLLGADASPDIVTSVDVTVPLRALPLISMSDHKAVRVQRCSLRRRATPRSGSSPAPASKRVRSLHYVHDQ
jgi:hypothetical protein